MKRKVITICCSASFYKQANDIKDELETLGYSVIVPFTAEVMKKSGNYDVSHYKTWFKTESDWPKKAELMKKHFEKVKEADAILVLNYEKNETQGYIGGNVLMEMALAFHLDIPIFVLNPVKKSPFFEEIMGMQPKFISGDLKAISL